MIPLEYRPIIADLEAAIIAELDRQHLDGEIEPSAAFGDSHFDAIDGDLVGRADWWKVAAAVIEAYWTEEGR